MATPLYIKLGIKNDSTILVLNQPKEYISFFFDFPSNVIINYEQVSSQVEFIHMFVKTNAELEHFYEIAKSSLKKNGMLWISWPKKTSKLTSEIDKFMVMAHGLNNGLVDTKVASIDDDWSGHKFMYRLKDR